jgi:hypothetical protein
MKFIFLSDSYVFLIIDFLYLIPSQAQIYSVWPETRNNIDDQAFIAVVRIGSNRPPTPLLANIGK